MHSKISKYSVQVAFNAHPSQTVAISWGLSYPASKFILLNSLNKVLSPRLVHLSILNILLQTLNSLHDIPKLLTLHCSLLALLLFLFNLLSFSTLRLAAFTT